MASSGSMKSGLLRGSAMRNVGVHGFENLATNGDSEGGGTNSGDGHLDETYLVAARLAAAKLTMGNQKAGVGKPPGAVRSVPVRGRNPFRDTGAGRVAGLFDLSPDRGGMDDPTAVNTLSSSDLNSEEAPQGGGTPVSVLTPSTSGKSDTSSEGTITPEKASKAKEAKVGAVTESALPNPGPRQYQGEFVRLQDHDRAMGMAGLALVAKNIALGAMVTETDTLRTQVQALSPKVGGSTSEKNKGFWAGPSKLDDSRTHDGAAQSQVSTSGDKTESSSSTIVAVALSDNTAEMERMRLEIKRLTLALKKEQQACFTLRAERVAWRGEKEDMEDELESLRSASASVGKMLGGDAEDTAYETLTVLSHALKGEDLSFDAPGTKRRCSEVAKAGGVVAVLGAMAAHGESERVQQVGAECLRRMAESSDEARKVLCQDPTQLLGTGSVPVLIRAMTQNPDSPEIAEAAGSVLVCVAKGGNGKELVGEEGKRALAEAAKNFPELSYYDWLISWF